MAYSDGLVYSGRVRRWDTENGWGVVESDSFDDPIWVHYSVVDPASWGVLGSGFRQLYVGDEVRLIVEHAEQDDFRLRASWIMSTRERGDAPEEGG